MEITRLLLLLLTCLYDKVYMNCIIINNNVVVVNNTNNNDLNK